jgi:hypothetical protein
MGYQGICALLSDSAVRPPLGYRGGLPKKSELTSVRAGQNWRMSVPFATRLVSISSSSSVLLST